MVRNCPKCNKTIEYSNKNSFNRAKRENRVCRSCRSKKNVIGNVFFAKGSLHTTLGSFKKGYVPWNKGKIGFGTFNKGKKRTEESKLKMKVSAIERIKRLGSIIGYNPKACKFIDEYGKKNGYNFQHALNGGEKYVAGFFIDGYDEERNIVFEYDEPPHDKPSKKIKDEHKQKCIINALKPTAFIRYNERQNKIYDALTGKGLSE